MIKMVMSDEKAGFWIIQKSAPEVL